MFADDLFSRIVERPNSKLHKIYAENTVVLHYLGADFEILCIILMQFTEFLWTFQARNAEVGRCDGH